MARDVLHLLAIAAITGALAAVWTPVPTPAALALAVGAMSLAVPHGPARLRRGLLVVGLGALAAAHAASARDAALAPPLGRWFASSGTGAAPLRLRGVLAEDATQAPSGAVRLRLNVTDVDAGHGWYRASGPTLLFVQGEAAAAALTSWTRGRHLTTTAVLRWPALGHNPGGPAPMRQRLARGYVLTGAIKSALLVEVAPGPWWHEAGAALRRAVRRNVATTLGRDRRETAAVVTAILVGDRSGLTPDLTERLIAAGTYHVVAISGGNVALITLLTVLVARRVVRSPRAVPLAALAVVVAYGWTVGGEPSVVRAVTAAAAWLVADALDVRLSAARLFSLVVLVVVVVEPLLIVQPGAWLSFGATLGILLCAARLVEWSAAGVNGGGRRVWRAVAGLGAASVAAELVLLPVGASMFSRVSVAGVLLNFVAVPAMAAVQMAGLAVVTAADAAPAVARVAALVAHAGTQLLVQSARLVDWLPMLAWRVPPPPLVVVAAYYAAVGWLLTRQGSRRRRRIAGGICAAAIAIIATGPALWLARPPQGTLRVTFLDVGQGDATVVQLPSGHVLVVDAGAATDAFDAGERIVAPALWALGVRQVDWVLFTHADLDHIGGVATVSIEFDAREVWEGIPVPADVHRAALHDRLSGAVWRQVRRGESWLAGGAEVTVLHPPEPDWERPVVRNDDSVVLRIRYGALDILLTGDISQQAERTLPLGDQDDRSQIRVLKVAHHGSRTSTGDALLEAFPPWAAVVSAGRNNAFGHPAPDVVERLDRRGAKVLRSDRDGAVTVESDGQSVTLRTWSGRSWRAELLPPRQPSPAARRPRALRATRRARRARAAETTPRARRTAR